MIRTIKDKKSIPAGIATVLNMDHPRWLEKVLLLVGFYTPAKRAIRTIKVNSKRKIRKEIQRQHTAAKVRKANKTTAVAAKASAKLMARPV